jgi:CheY-like chemotaxis protein
MSGTVLLVDDDQLFAETVATVLRNRNDMQVVRAGNGREAIRLLDHHGSEINLILCDLNMPDFDGIELVAEFSRRRIPAPIVFVTGAVPSVVDAAEKIARAHGLRVVETLIKPINLARLSQVARDALVG